MTVTSGIEREEEEETWESPTKNCNGPGVEAEEEWVIAVGVGQSQSDHCRQVEQSSHPMGHYCTKVGQQSSHWQEGRSGPAVVAAVGSNSFVAVVGNAADEDPWFQSSLSLEMGEAC